MKTPRTSFLAILLVATFCFVSHAAAQRAVMNHEDSLETPQGIVPEGGGSTLALLSLALAGLALGGRRWKRPAV